MYPRDHLDLAKISVSISDFLYFLFFFRRSRKPTKKKNIHHHKITSRENLPYGLSDKVKKQKKNRGTNISHDSAFVPSPQSKWNLKVK